MQKEGCFRFELKKPIKQNLWKGQFIEYKTILAVCTLTRWIGYLRHLPMGLGAVPIKKRLKYIENGRKRLYASPRARNIEAYLNSGTVVELASLLSSWGE